MASKRDASGVFELVQQGLKDSIAYSRGELSLITTSLPAPPPRIVRRDLARLRKRLRMSQAVFAAVLNVSTKTVQSWEHGLREPSDAALRTLQIIRHRPDVLDSLFRWERAPSRRGARRAVVPRRARAS